MDVGDDGERVDKFSRLCQCVGRGDLLGCKNSLRIQCVSSKLLVLMSRHRKIIDKQAVTIIDARSWR